MKNYKKIFFLLFISILAFVNLTACENSKTSEEKYKIIRVAASPVPHAEILYEIKDVLLEQGYKLEIVEYTDYIEPNLVVSDGDFDANFFQHKPHLDAFNKTSKNKLISVASVHYEPLAIYAGKSSDLKYIKQNSIIAIPNDTTNKSRALLLLENNGLIKLRTSAGFECTRKDIVKNPYNINLLEIEAKKIPEIVKDVDFIILNGNYALEAGFDVSKSLSIEEQDSDAAKKYANILAVKASDDGKKNIIALVEALKANKVKQFIYDSYKGSVVAID